MICFFDKKKKSNVIMVHQKIITWTYINPKDEAPLPKKTVLCTNNIESTYNDGIMSNVWVGNLERKKISKDKYEVMCVWTVHSTYGDVGRINYYSEYIPDDISKLYLRKNTGSPTKDRPLGYYSLVAPDPRIKKDVDKIKDSDEEIILSSDEE